MILNNNKIEHIRNIEKLKNLKRLELRQNKLKIINGFQDLKNIELLTLSCNQIKVVEDQHIGEWIKLKELGLFGNFLGNAEDNCDNIIQFKYLLDVLKKKTPNLSNLYIGGNHFTNINKPNIIVKEFLPYISKIDGTLV